MKLAPVARLGLAVQRLGGAGAGLPRRRRRADREHGGAAAGQPDRALGVPDGRRRALLLDVGGPLPLLPAQRLAPTSG